MLRIKLLYLFVIISCSLPSECHEESSEESDCDGTHVRGKFHKKEVLMRGVNRPYHLSSYHPEHKVYFSYNIGQEEEDTFKIGYLEKNKSGHHEVREIKEIKNGFATAIDHKDHIVYFGGSDGLYKEHLIKKDSKIEKITSINHNIWDMFFKHVLYYINFPVQHLYKYDPTQTGNKKRNHKAYISERMYQFAIDGDDDKFFTNDVGLYMIKNGSDDRHLIKGPQVFRAIEINNKGEAYFCGKHAIYVANKTHHVLEEIASIRNIFGLTFDAHDNIIYSDPHEIVKLVPEDCT